MGRDVKEEKSMKLNKQRSVAFGTLAVLTATTLGGALVSPVQAKKSNTWKTAAIVGAAATGYGLLKKNNKVAIIGGVATGLSYWQYKKAKKKEKVEEARRIQWYKNRYGRNWRTHYKRGA